jgi:hypothetical protein
VILVEGLASVLEQLGIPSRFIVTGDAAVNWH